MNNKVRGFFGERPLPKFEVDPQVLRRRTRRDVLVFWGWGCGSAGGRQIPPAVRYAHTSGSASKYALQGRSGF